MERPGSRASSIISNLHSIDGYYEGPDGDLGSLFTHFHPDYAGDEQFDHYNTERLRAADRRSRSSACTRAPDRDQATS